MAAAATATVSPRISFSHDSVVSGSATNIIISDVSDDSSSAAAASEDFDFSVSLDMSSIQDSSPADDIFSDGMLLPLSSLQPHGAVGQKAAANGTTNLESPSREYCPAVAKLATPSPPSFWNGMGRSSSVGTGIPKPRSVWPFPRSKSTGSHPAAAQTQSGRGHHKSKQQQRSGGKNTTSSASHHFYYNSSSSSSSRNKKGININNGVMINPVINVPSHFIPRGGSTASSSSASSGGGGGVNINSLFAYLLCNCRDKSGKQFDYDAGEF